MADDGIENIEAQLCAYIDGGLSSAERQELERHLAANPAHLALVQDLIRNRQALASLPREKAPSEANEPMRSRLEREQLLGSDDLAAGTALRLNRWPQLLSAAAIVGLAVGLGVLVWSVLPGKNPSIQMLAGDEASVTKPAPALAMVPQETSAVAGADPFKSKTDAEVLTESEIVAERQSGAIEPVLITIASSDVSRANEQVVRELLAQNVDWSVADAPREPVEQTLGDTLDRRWSMMLNGTVVVGGGGEGAGMALAVADHAPVDRKSATTQPAAGFAWGEARATLVEQDAQKQHQDGWNDFARGELGPSVDALADHAGKLGLVPGLMADGKAELKDPAQLVQPQQQRVFVAKEVSASQISQITANMARPELQQWPRVSRGQVAEMYLQKSVENNWLQQLPAVKELRQLANATGGRSPGAMERTVVSNGFELNYGSLSSAHAMNRATPTSAPTTAPATQQSDSDGDKYTMIIIVEPFDAAATTQSAAEPAITGGHLADVPALAAPLLRPAQPSTRPAADNPPVLAEPAPAAGEKQ